MIVYCSVRVNGSSEGYAVVRKDNERGNKYIYKVKKKNLKVYCDNYFLAKAKDMKYLGVAE